MKYYKNIEFGISSANNYAKTCMIVLADKNYPGNSRLTTAYKTHLKCDPKFNLLKWRSEYVYFC